LGILYFKSAILYEHNQPINHGQTPIPEMLHARNTKKRNGKKRKETERNGKKRKETERNGKKRKETERNGKKRKETEKGGVVVFGLRQYELPPPHTISLFDFHSRKEYKRKLLGVS
jgi:hypothetical protein